MDFRTLTPEQANDFISELKEYRIKISEFIRGLNKFAKEPKISEEKLDDKNVIFSPSMGDEADLHGRFINDINAGNHGMKASYFRAAATRMIGTDLVKPKTEYSVNKDMKFVTEAPKYDAKHGTDYATDISDARAAQPNT